MKEVLAKDLKVGDVVYDTQIKLNKFIVSYISNGILWLSEIKLSTSGYSKNENGMYAFNFGYTIWYMEED